MPSSPPRGGLFTVITATLRGLLNKSDALLAHERRARYFGWLRDLTKRALRLARNAITPLAIVIGLGMVAFFVVAESKPVFFAFLVYLPLAWLLVFALAAEKSDEYQSVRSLLTSFQYQVDRAKQNLGQDNKAVDESVKKAFDRLHREVRALLLDKKIGMSQIRREVLRFHDPDEPMGTRWRPPTLSEMGYVIAAADAPEPANQMLALYKYSGEHSSGNGALMDTYTILKEGSSDTFSGVFAAKVQSPFRIRLVVPEDTRRRLESPGSQPEQTAPANTDLNVAYILSMLGPVTRADTRAVEANLRALSVLPVDTAPAQALTAPAVRAHLRTVLTESIAHDDSSLRTAAAALRQAPQQFVCALADVSHDAGDQLAGGTATIDTLAAILLPSAAQHRPALSAELKDFALTVQSLAAIPSTQVITHPGSAYVEARGAEADAGLLSRIAQLLAPSVKDAAAPIQPVFVTTHLTEDYFRMLLQGFRDLQPGGKAQADIDVLAAALDAKTLRLNTVDGTGAVTLQNVAQSTAGPLYLLTDIGRVNHDTAAGSARAVLWTLSGRALEVPADTLDRLQQIELRVRLILRQASDA